MSKVDRVDWLVITSEALPQTDELAAQMSQCLKRSDAEFWILDSA